MSRRTSLASVAGTWVAKSPCGDDPLVRRSHTDQWDTRLYSGIPCSEVLVQVASLKILAALTRPL
jgi:hypothetical protein